MVLRAVSSRRHKHKDQRRRTVRATPYINDPIAPLAEVLHTDGRRARPKVIPLRLLQTRSRYGDDVRWNYAGSSVRTSPTPWSS